jgi:putative flippase GtrA
VRCDDLEKVSFVARVGGRFYRMLPASLMNFTIARQSSQHDPQVGSIVDSQRGTTSLHVPQLLKYGMVSVLALALDIAVLWLLVTVGYRSQVAAVFGYSTGLVLHFGLSKWFVFAPQTQKTNTKLFVEFAASGLVGLLVTWAIMALFEWMSGVPLIVSKGIAVLSSFLLVYARRTVVFSA